MVAKDAVQPEAEQAVDLPVVLGVPTEAGKAEPPVEGHQELLLRG